MKIKVCGMRDISNIQSALKLMPDYIGFIFYPGSRRYIGNDPALANYIKSIQGVKKVGVFVNEGVRDVAREIAAYGLDMVQLHGDEPISFCKTLNHYIPVIKVFHVDEEFDFNELKSYEQACSYYLFDTVTKGHGGSGKTFDWRLLEKNQSKKEFFLSGGIGLEHVDDIQQLRYPALMAIDVNSRFETEPGLKNIQQLETLLHEIRN